MSTSSTGASSGIGWFGRLLARLDCIWEVFQDVGRVLRYARLSLVVTLLAGLALIFTDQGQDIVIINAEEVWRCLLLYPAVIFWALNAWYWARVTLRHGATIPTGSTCLNPCFADRLTRVQWLVRHVPRVIGAGAFVMIAIAQAIAALGNGLAAGEAGWLVGFAVLNLALAAVFYYATMKRRQVSNHLADWMAQRTARPALTNWMKVPGTAGEDHATAKHWLELPGATKVVLAVLSLALVIVFVWVVVDPVAFAVFSSDVVFLVGASLWIAPATWLLFVSKRGDFPMLLLLVVLAGVFSFVNDNHALRRSTGIDLPDPSARSSLEAAFDAWRKRWREQRTGSPTLVVVATAGGGSRAAYWTASVLGTIQDLDPDFDNKLFVVSGVSGGSVGAAVYRGLLTAAPARGASCSAEARRPYLYRDCARAILRQNFLSPMLAAMLYPDLVQRFLPWHILPDRAGALEQAWEAAWRDALGPTQDARNLFAEDFLAAWPAAGGCAAGACLPALALNGTSVATGKRIVTSNLDLSSSLTDAFDFFHRWPRHIPMSTAANNSARFPIIGPAGTITGEPLDRIVDGGYFENFGATTAQDLLQSLTRHCGRTNTCRANLVVIQISSDPDYPGVARRNGTAAVEKSGRKPQAPHPGRFATEIWSPVKTLLNTRTARGVLAAQALHDWVEAQSADGEERFIEFRLDIPKTRNDPPLGWALSDSAIRTMDCQLLRSSNRENLTRLVKLLHSDAGKLDRFLQELQSDAELQCGG